jgi:hypothetical protein
MMALISGIVVFSSTCSKEFMFRGGETTTVEDGMGIFSLMATTMLPLGVHLGRCNLSNSTSFNGTAKGLFESLSTDPMISEPCGLDLVTLANGPELAEVALDDSRRRRWRGGCWVGCLGYWRFGRGRRGV